MTDSAVKDATRVDHVEPHDFRPPGFVRQVTTMVWRSLKHIKRQPEMLTDVTIQPVMFVLLFAFVFGG